MSFLGSRSDFLKILLFIGIFYIPPGMLFFNSVRLRALETQYNERKDNLSSVVDLVNSLAFAGYEEDICAQLNAETRAERIILFSYKSPQHNCSVPSATTPDQYPSAVQGGLYSKATSFGEIQYVRTKTENDADLVVGFEKPLPPPLWKFIIASKGVLSSMTIDVLLVLWVVMGFFILFVSRNLNRIKRLYREQAQLPFHITWFEKAFGWLTVDDLGAVEEATKETNALLKKLQDNSSFEETSLQYSVLAEIKKQISQGQKIEFPFRFHGVTVRVDINGYSSIMRSTSLEMTRTINMTFKSIAAELAYRYEGLFENSAGDEVVYCFKGADPVLRAVAFARDLMTEFSQERFKDTQGTEFSLFVKASLDSSEMLMDIGTARLEFDGLSLLYTNRMFAGLPLKNQNVLIIPPKLQESVSRLCVSTKDIHRISAKGMELEVLYIEEFAPRLAKDIDPLAMPYFRSDQDLCWMLKEIAHSPRSSDSVLAALVTASKVKKTSPLVADAWRSCVRSLSENAVVRSERPQLLPTLLSLGPDLIGAHNWDDSCSEVVRLAGLTAQERVTENAVEALVKVGRPHEAQDLLSSQDATGRLKANGLIAQALAHPSDESLRPVRLMATSKNTSERASGLYAAATLVLQLRVHSDRSVALLKEYRALLECLRKSYARDVHLSERVRNKILEATSQ